MMMKTMMTAMKTSISEVMETMFFLPVEFLEDPAKQYLTDLREKPNKVCRIEFTGDYRGSVFLMVPPSLLSEMTENFMGESGAGLDNNVLEGTLTETVNMIAGNALKKIEAQKPFELSLPQIVPESLFPETEGGGIIIETTGSKMAVHITLG